MRTGECQRPIVQENTGFYTSANPPERRRPRDRRAIAPLSSDIIDRGLHPLLHRTLLGSSVFAFLPTIRARQGCRSDGAPPRGPSSRTQLHERVRYRCVDRAILATLGRLRALSRWHSSRHPAPLAPELSKRRWGRWCRRRSWADQHYKAWCVNKETQVSGSDTYTSHLTSAGERVEWVS